MTKGAQIAGAVADRDAAGDWQALRDSGDFQLTPLPPVQPPEQPDWLRAIADFVQKLLNRVFGPIGEALGVSMPVIEKVLLALAALLVLFMLWRLLRPLLDRLIASRPPPGPEWTPDRAAAVALLEDADRLAAEGRYGEAARLLLQRSVHHIAQARPDWLLPASTAREIAAFPLLPARARQAFGEIAVRVERSLFALRELDAGDWTAARAAYADFALQPLAEGAA